MLGHCFPNSKKDFVLATGQLASLEFHEGRTLGLLSPVEIPGLLILGSRLAYQRSTILMRTLKKLTTTEIDREQER